MGGSMAYPLYITVSIAITTTNFYTALLSIHPAKTEKELSISISLM